MAKIDPATETARYIDSLGTEALARSAAYTAGTHWLILGGLLVMALVTWVIVRSGLLTWLAGRLETRSWAIRTLIVCVGYFVVSALVSLPWTIFSEWGYDRSFGRTSQSLSDFVAQNLVDLAVTSLMGGLFFLGVYALIRKAGRRWWIWSGGLTAFAASAILMISPILIEPLFNEYEPVPEGPVRTALLEMADQAGIPHDRIVMFDGSRQSNNFTANVTGVLGSGRIAISDVALQQASLDEVKAVTGHEIGHYMLGHVWRFVALFALLAVLGFFFADRIFGRVASAFGSKVDIQDPSGLPVLMFILTSLITLSQPISYGVTRRGEIEADSYSLSAVGLPDALAGALLKSSEYRYPKPSALQEMLFYTHPSIERRIYAAMVWKAEYSDKQTQVRKQDVRNAAPN
jgi:STE24 endopeptidase